MLEDLRIRSLERQYMHQIVVITTTALEHVNTNRQCTALWIRMGTMGSILECIIWSQVIFVLVKPSTFAIISKASGSNDQGNTQGFVAGIQAIASLLSLTFMSPLACEFQAYCFADRSGCSCNIVLV